MVVIMQQQQQNPSALVPAPQPPPPQHINNAQSSASSASAAATAVTSLRSPSSSATAVGHSQLSSPSSLAPVPIQQRQPLLSSVPLPPDHAVGAVVPIAAALPSGAGDPPVVSVTSPLARVRLSDIAPYDGAPAGPYVRAVEALSGSLMRHNAALIELGSEDSALMRCGLEGSRLFFRSRAQLGDGKGSRGVYMYRAGRAFEDWDSSPPCMADIFRCMGKASRSALCAIARHLRLRSE
ncbi:hypothetical protein Ahy_A03g016478 isoform E [Arachis hypogaea]|uniref:Uncharacterized protein n=1 Tax=Arachis hypogaea TaxID=3818 RepID=A0A445E3K1_ARAHY|nr:hypothetical protein Ahy_A03g016478 isoform E [Arachis hypogaea]